MACDKELDFDETGSSRYLRGPILLARYRLQERIDVPTWQEFLYKVRKINTFSRCKMTYVWFNDRTWILIQKSASILHSSLLVRGLRKESSGAIFVVYLLTCHFL